MMQKESISTGKMICTMIMFIFGSNVIMGVTSAAGQDSWLCILIAIIGFIPIALIYARIVKLHPGKNYFQILEDIFGRVFGKILIVINIWYAMHLAGMVIRNFSEFIRVVSLTETPEIPIIMIILFVSAYLAKSGMFTLGRWSVFVILMIAVMVLITVLSSLNIMDFSNVLPVFEHDLKVVSSGAFTLFAFPFAETVVILGLASSFKKNIKPYKMYLLTIFFASLFLFAVFFRNLFVLGPDVVNDEYFPSYAAAKIINLGEFLSRIENIVSINLVFAGITKITICIIAASQGVKKLLNMEDYNKVIMPVSLLILAVSAVTINNIMEMFRFIDVYSYYAIPFQLIIPIAVWIISEIKNLKQKKRTLQPVA